MEEGLSVITAPMGAGKTMLHAFLVDLADGWHKTGATNYRREQELKSLRDELLIDRTQIAYLASHGIRDGASTLLDGVSSLTLGDLASARQIDRLADVCASGHEYRFTDHHAWLVAASADGNGLAPNPTRWGAPGRLSEGAVASARRPDALNGRRRLKTRVRIAEPAVHAWAAALLQVVDYVIALVRAAVVLVKVSLTFILQKPLYSLALVAVSMHHRHRHEPDDGLLLFTRRCRLSAGGCQ